MFKITMELFQVIKSVIQWKSILLVAVCDHFHDFALKASIQLSGRLIVIFEGILRLLEEWWTSGVIRKIVLVISNGSMCFNHC